MLELQSQSKGAATSEPLLDVTGLTKRFTGTLALDNIDFDVRRGEVHALLGPERRGQVHADKNPGGRLSGGRGRDPL